MTLEMDTATQIIRLASSVAWLIVAGFVLYIVIDVAIKVRKAKPKKPKDWKL